MAVATASAVSPAAKKKTAGAKKPKPAASHPPFLIMISEAILSLKERTGSSQYAVAKFIEEKYKPLPPNFRKVLLVQLKKFVASGKLVKVKASYKLPPASTVVKKPAAAKPKDASSAVLKSKPKAVKAAAKPKPKRKVAAPVKPKAKVAAKPKAKAKSEAVVKPTLAAKTAKTSTAAKKVKSPAKKKIVVTKKPKSAKSAAKKAAKKAKK